METNADLSYAVNGVNFKKIHPIYVISLLSEIKWEKELQHLTTYQHKNWKARL